MKSRKTNKSRKHSQRLFKRLFERVCGKTLQRFFHFMTLAMVALRAILVVPLVAFGFAPFGVTNPADSPSAPAKFHFEQNSLAQVQPESKVFEVSLKPSLTEVEARKRRYVLARERPVEEYAAPTPEPSLDEKRALVKQAAAHYGIDWRYLEAVWQVESGKSWDTSVASHMGATGPWQFLRGTWRAHAFVDGGGDGAIAITSAADGAYAAAHLLAQAGADRGDWDAALFSYNHSRAYVNLVKRIAEGIGE